MTRSDHPSEDQGNPFDTGLPMLRMPTKPRSKRRPAMARRTAPRRSPDIDIREPLPDPFEVPASGQRSGEWDQWLDAPGPAAQPSASDSEQGPYPSRDDTEPEFHEESRAPAITDRSGGNPGPRLRHPRRRRENLRSNQLLGVLIMLGIAVAVVSVLLTALHTTRRNTPAAVTATPARTDGTRGEASATISPAEPAGEIATPGCVPRHTPDVVSGTDPGGTTDGPSAILAFERAYYVQRSGYAARAVVAPDASVPPAEQIQRGINQLPAGTRYCVQITRATAAGEDEAQWEVRLTQQVPGQQPTTFTQIVTTRTVADRTLISAIDAG